MQSLKRTPLFGAHQKLGARLVEFGGWEMPVQYTSIIDEHHAVRSAAGIFDISHMGEVLVRGAAAEQFLNFVLTNDIRKLRPGLGQYTILCNSQGGAIDDLYAYQLAEQKYLLIINASRIDSDVPWLQQQHEKFPARNDLNIRNVSDELGAVAVQGPRVANFIDAAIPASPIAASSLKKNEILRVSFQGSEIYIARTGYTGEDGFEIVAPATAIESVWNTILQAGAPFGLKPAGLGARDTLRTEVCYPLYGHELDENTSPIEAGLGFFVALNKGDFIGRAILAEQKEKGTSRKLVAFKMAERSAPPRPHYPIWSSGPDAKLIGQTTSGTQSPSLTNGIGLGYVTTEFAKPETPVEIEIRGKRSRALVTPKPLYKRP